MKTISTAFAALVMTAMMSSGPANEAKADGGVVLGVGAYLLADAIVGRKCGRDDWPFNFIAKIGDEIHGRRGCYYRGHYYDDRRGHRRHHRHHRQYR